MACRACHSETRARRIVRPLSTGPDIAAGGILDRLQLAAAGLARGRLDIKGNGGVFDADDVRAMLRAGACCVDLYSAFIYEGWDIAARINRGLAPLC